MGGVAKEPEPVAVGYRHPNFHPVPTRPVFAPADSPIPPPTIPARTPVPPKQGTEETPKSIRVPTPPVPEKLPKASPNAESKADQVTGVPRELDSSLSDESWVFRWMSPKPITSSEATRQAETSLGPVRR